MVPEGQPIPGQRLSFAQSEYSDGVVGRRQAMFDFYRHGKYPDVQNNDKNNGFYKATGGKIAYNILYADNHVDSPPDRETGYKACRIRFPG